MHADAPAMWLVLLSTVLMPVCVIGSKTAIKERVREYYAWLLVLEAAMLGVFLAKNLLFFYVAFEFTLVPMYFLIAGWGAATGRPRPSSSFVHLHRIDVDLGGIGVCGLAICRCKWRMEL